MDSKIRVGVRIRPLNSKELEASSPSVVGSDSGKYVVTKPPAKKNCFEYDWSFDLNSTNRMVYDMSCRPLIENIFDGFNCTFFAYGQTSSGKTHTLGGADMSEGVIPFALQDIFERRRDLHALGTKVDIELSYIEIYREECFDLLSKEGTRVKLDLKETSGGKTVLDGVTSQPVADIDSVMTLLRDGAKVRSTGQTAMNAHSSRSHSICTLNVRVVRATTGTVVSQLHLVDLAGSERAKKTQATGDAFQEGISINRGLLALGNVVSALASKTARPSTTASDSHIHVPYRESKLTRLLKDALGGNGMTVMLACVSPADANFEETLNTLRFASRASSIVNSARVNHSVGEHTDTVSLLKEISELRSQLTLLQAIQGRGDANKTGSVVRFEPSHRDNRDNRDTQAERESADRVHEEYYFMVTSALRVTSSLKSVLLTCLQEGSYVVDGDLLNIQADLAQIRKGLNLPRADTNTTTTTTTTTTKKIKSEPNNTTTNTTTTDENTNHPNNTPEIADLDMESMLALPPIMTLIEEVRLLEKDLRAVEKTTKALTGAHRVSTFKRESLSDHSWADDSMLSGDMSVSILQSSDDPNLDNLSFEQSFVSDGGFNPMESFAMDCSFNAMDALNIEQEIAQFMLAEGSIGASSTMNSTGGAQGFVKQAKMSFAEEEEARQASKGLLAKEAEVSRIAALTDKYLNSIRALRSEIQAIENDQEKLQNKQKKPLLPSTSTGSTSTTSHTTNKPSSGTSVAEEMRIKQQLREKTKLLEEKMKLLRTKESEFGKISSQKARLVGEVEGMKKVVEDHKRKRADLQRKMREEQTVHRAETTQIKHSEIQARRRELQAQQSVLRLEGQMQTKERVWKAQLESKERESKQLKELVGKQQTVRSMQAAVGKGPSSLPPTASTIAAAGALLSSQGSSGLTTKEALDLKLWVDNELESQCKRMQTQESLSKEMLARTQVARQLQAARAAAAAPPTDGDAPPTAASMKTLENEIRARSSTIASLNGVLTDLGNASVVDKKRFSRFTDLKQARLVSEVLFELASKTQRREQSATRRMRAMQEQLLKCRKQLQDANNSVAFYQEQAARRAEGEGYIFDDEESESAEMDETFYPTDESDADASDHSDSDDSFHGSKKSKPASAAAASKKAAAAGAVTKSAKRKSDSSDSSMSLNDSDLMAPPSKKPRGKGANASNNRAKRVITSDNEDAESDAHSTHDRHDNQSDASDSESDSETKKKPVKRKAVKKSVSTDSTAVADGAVPVVAAPKRAKRVHAVDPDFDDSEITFPLAKHTINELKRFLGCKGLTVSGVKAELIERLEKALGTRAAQVNDENAENIDTENVCENVAVFELGEDVELEQVVVEI